MGKRSGLLPVDDTGDARRAGLATPRKVLTCGGFDPLHGGHLGLFEESALLGQLTVALNSDKWLLRKKGYVFMPWQERAKIIAALRCVHRVVPFDDSDGTACWALREFMPDIFSKGGDRGPDNTPEAKLCGELGIDVIYGVGGEKTQSSSHLVQRQWGFYEVLAEGNGFKVKRLVVMPGKTTSRQKHKCRSEHWLTGEKHEYHPAGEWHQLSNDGDAPLEVIEVQTGTYFGEDDIERA